MLDDLYMKILDMTAVSSLVILAVLVVRLLLKRAPKFFSYALWAVVLLRLLCPVALEAPVSLVPEITPAAQEYDLNDEPISIIGAGAAALDAVGDALNGGLGIQHIHTTEREEDGTFRVVTTDWYDVWVLFGQYVWIAGFAGMLLWSGISYGKLKKKLASAVAVGEDVFLAEGIPSPFVVGLIRPRICLPGNLSETEYSYIILHEQHHIRRGDHIFKALGYLALCIHWFNPLVWVAFILAGRDMEMSCDEAVVRKLGPEIRADYAASLLSLATGRRIIAGTPLAFGEGDPKGRIKNLSKWKRPVLWVSFAAAVLCAVLALCLLTDPVRSDHVGSAWYYGTVTDPGADHIGLLGNDGNEYTFRLSEYYDDDHQLKTGDHVMVSAREEGGVLITSRAEPAERIAARNLEDAIHGAILAFSRSGRTADACHCASFVQLAQREENGRLTVYGVAVHEAYRVENGRLEGVSGSNIPTVLTFGTREDGEFVLAEYWQPRDGSYYADDIRAKYPVGVWPDTQTHIHAQTQQCYAQAVEFYGLDTAPIIAELLANTTDVHDLDYREMRYYGRYTLEYCFAQFMTGEEPEEREANMARVCREIITDMGQKDEHRRLEGQAWFDAFRENALKLAEEYDRYDIQEVWPGSWVLLNMLGSDGQPVDKTGKVFDTRNISSIAFSTPNAPEGLAVPAEDLPEIIAWLDTFVIGDKAASFLAPGSNSIGVRITYADGSVVENGLSTVIVGGAEFYMDYDNAPGSYLDLVNSVG